MVFIAERDKELWSRSVKIGKCEMGVNVMSYDGGPSKIQLTRKLDNEFSRLGRFTVEEIKGISPLVNEAIAFMSKDNQDQAEHVEKVDGLE